MEGSPFSRLTEEAIGELEEQGKGTVGHLWGASGHPSALTTTMYALVRDAVIVVVVVAYRPGSHAAPSHRPTHPFLLMSSLWGGDDLLIEH